MAMKTLRHPKTNAVCTVPEAEAEKLCRDGWVFTSKYELKRQAAIVRLNTKTEKAA